MNWSLEKVLGGLHDDIERRLSVSREALGHSGTKGDASEAIWLALLDGYLPKRYAARKAHVVDSNGTFSEQIDVVIFDRQYSPFIFNFEGEAVIPAESVYAAFEAKQTINSALVEYAQKKVASVRKLHRTSLPIPSASGMLPAKVPAPILGGILTFDSDWKPPLGEPLTDALAGGPADGRLNLGCAAAHGIFVSDGSGGYRLVPNAKAATAFLLELIAQLQDVATVPMIDVRAYAAWLKS